MTLDDVEQTMARLPRRRRPAPMSSGRDFGQVEGGRYSQFRYLFVQVR
jgi:hypothetical protein